MREFADGTLGGDDFVFFVTGFVCAAIVGWLSIRFLLAFLTTNTLRPFVYYRVALGVIVLAIVGAQTSPDRRIGRWYHGPCTRSSDRHRTTSSAHRSC